MWWSLMWICEACEKLANCLWVDWVANDTRRVGSKTREPHGEPPGIKRMKLHEAGPGLIEQDVFAEMADALEDHLGIMDSAVIGALLDDRDAEGARLAPGIRVLDQRMVADALAQGGFVEGVPAHRTDQPPGVAHRRDVDRNAAGHHQRTMMGGLVIVAVEQDQVAVGDERAQHHLVGSRSAVEHEPRSSTELSRSSRNTASPRCSTNTRPIGLRL